MKVKELLQKGFWTLTARVLGATLAFLMTLLFARVLGAGNFGLFSLSLTFLMIFSVLARWGTDQVLLKQIGANWKSNSSLAKGYMVYAIKLVLMLSVFVSLIIGVAHNGIANSIFNKPNLAESLFYIGLLVVPFSINYTLAEVYKGIGKPVLSSYLQNVIAPFVALVLGGGMLQLGLSLSLEKMIGVFGVGIISALICSLFFWHKIISSVKPSKLTLKQLFIEGGPMLLISSSGLVLAWSDMIVLGVWGSEVELGIYSVASKTVLVTSLVLVAMNSITAPKYALLYYSGDVSGLAKLAQNSSKILFFLVIIPTLILLIFPDKIMGLFGDEFVVGASILMVLMIGQFVNVFCGSVGYILTMTGNELKMRNILLVTAVVNIILSVVLVQSYGGIGVAIGTAFSMILWNVWAIFEVKRQLGFWSISLNFNKKVG